MSPAAVVENLWTQRCHRSQWLRGRYPFAEEVLNLFEALAEVQEPAYQATLQLPPEPATVAARAVDKVLPEVVAATMAVGPQRLREAVVGRFHSAGLEELIAGWLLGHEQSGVDRYLARASTQPILEALGDRAGEACAASLVTGASALHGGARCPRCDGLPQLSYSGFSGEDLVTPPRHLMCSRCLGSWQFPRMTCPACGESQGSKLTIWGEAGIQGREGSAPVSIAEDPPEQPPTFSHVRIEGCQTCRRYLLAFDLRRDTGCLPWVDELACLPLDLYARDHGLSKVVSNLMGF